ncbi:Cytoplasmic tRNA 2-thiolation protein 2, variant 2 [Basidiobolus ranarum]
MCSLQDDIDIEKKSKPQLKTCVKCKVERAQYLVRHAQYCKQCFLHTLVGKFRVMISKSKFVVGRKECKPNVLLAFSGGASSRALVHMMNEFHVGDPAVKKKTILDNVKICHIDESIICGPEEGTLKQAENIISQYPFQFIGASLEDVFSSEYTDSDFEQVLRTEIVTREEGSKSHDQLKAVIESSTLTNKEKANALLNNIVKATAKEDMISYLKNKLLIQIAKRENCSIILLGDSSTRIAVKCIAYTSKGRGFSLPYDVAAEIEVEKGVGYLRPLRDCLTKELGIYNYLHKLETVFVPTITTGAPIKASIDRLTEEFITSLDRDFPSTVSTVVRTASKLTTSKSSEQNERCTVCLR